MKRLLIIDGYNQWIRGYVCDPSISLQGDPIGGLKGFLKILNKLFRETRPDCVVLIWDGPGGSAKRRSINSSYKDGRKPWKLNRNIHVLTAEQEEQNKTWQHIRTIEYINNLPVIQIMREDVEADDVISFVLQLPRFKEYQKIIVSSDKDFYQLLDEKTVIARPAQKEIVNLPTIVERHGVHPTNFALARAIVGDKSDNLPGVPGVGLPTVAKRFAFLKESTSYFLSDILTFCKEQNKKLKVFQNVVNNEDLIRENYKLMQLYVPSISIHGREAVLRILDTHEPEFNATELRKEMFRDGMGELLLNDLFLTMRRIVVNHKDKGNCL